MQAIRLRTEYLTNPTGIDITRPRLSWNCEGGIRQTAYEIVARDEAGSAVWKSGKVVSSKMHLIDWGARELKSREIIFWKVRLWDENGHEGEWSKEAFFELGLLSGTDWSACWITGDYRVDKRKRYPVDCFRKEIQLSGKRITKARIYAAACGLYEICIDGVKAGVFCLAPGYTDYRKRVQYQTIDVTKLLAGNVTDDKANKKILTVQLADGWYRGSIGAHGIRNEYGTETKFICQLEIAYEDGSVQTVVTDEDWQWSNDGAIRMADNKDGEAVDANRIPSFSGRAKKTSHPVIPTASNNVLLKENEVFSPQIHKSPSGKTILDLGQNIAGYLSFRILAKKGQLLRFRFGELLDEKGELTQKNIQTGNEKKHSPLQEILYVCRDGENEYKTRFSIFGFQYVEVTSGELKFESWDIFGQYGSEFFEACHNTEEADLSEADFKAYAVYSQMEEIGFFDSSNELLNRFVKATKWSAKGNSADIPTDCPTRERHGWTGDAQIFFMSASYLFDYAAFSMKYLRDVYDWQKKNGRLPQIAPYGGVDFYMYVMNGSVGWSDIGVILPYCFWKINGDIRILERYYDGMKRYAHFMQRRCGKWGGVYAKPTHVKGEYKKYIVNAGQSYDEWAEPQDVKAFVWTDFAEPHPEVSTAYTAHIMDLMVEIAHALGKKEDISNYREYAEGCKKAYQELVRTKEYSLDTDRQARLVRPLSFNLLDIEQAEYAKKRLIKALGNYGYRLGTGFLSTPLILDVLAKIDTEASYKLLENEEIPGWLSMPRAGASTIWESWEGPDAVGEVASLNHYSKGALCQWLFEGMCGIHVDGENHFTIAPLPGGKFTFAQASTKSVYGTVKSGWKKTENGQFCFKVKIPANTAATFLFPDGTRRELTAGEYMLENSQSNPLN